jgi:hypothetical protein
MDRSEEGEALRERRGMIEPRGDEDVDGGMMAVVEGLIRSARWRREKNAWCRSGYDRSEYVGKEGGGVTEEQKSSSK